MFGSPTVSDGVVYVGSFDQKLHAVDAETGAKKWTYSTGDKVQSSPTVSDGVVYVGSDDQKLYALDAKTGAKKWTYSTGGNVFGSPAVSDGLVYVGCWTRHKLHAVHAETSKGVPPTTRNRPLFIVPVTASVPV